MKPRDGRPNQVLRTPLTRRQVVKGSLALGGGALAASLAVPGRPRLSARAQAPTFTREASIVSWGFGVEETNPMAFSRVDAFRKAYPTIKLEVVPEYDDQKLLTAAASKQLPDLLWIDRFAISGWAARGVLTPLDEMVTGSEFDTTRFYEAALREATYDGKLYGIPQFMDVRPLYVNNDALMEIGVDPATLDTSNWDQLSEYGAKLVKRTGDKVDRWGLDHKTQDNYLWLWGRGNGGSFMSEDGQQATFSDPKNVEALDWALKAYEAQGGFQSYEAVRTTWQGDEQFARGQVAMTLYENWMMGIVARVAPTLNFSLLPVKQRGGTGSVSFTGGRAWAIPQGAKDPEAAWEFIKFMTALETWQIGANAVKASQTQQGRPYIPSLTADKTADQMQIEQLYTPINPNVDAAVALLPQLLEQSENRQISNSPVSNQLNDIMDQTGIDPALRKEKSPQESLDEANTKAQEAIDTFGV